MGQYHYVVNFDRREYVHPHDFDDGLKLMEFGASAGGTMQGLAVLLAASNRGAARGGGDLHPWIDGHGAWGDGRKVEGVPAYADALMRHVVGRWAGERIAIVGDYFEPSDVPGLIDEYGTPWDTDAAERGWVNISSVVVQAIELDYYTHEDRHKADERGVSRGTAFGAGKAPTATLDVETGEIRPVALEAS